MYSFMVSIVAADNLVQSDGRKKQGDEPVSVP